ncbi:MAG: YfhO family protein [Bacteroidales bacterium]|nr:YfhO family protein [Bacteroidales bacterium]
MKEKLKELVPHIVVILAFIIVSACYFYPIMGGKDLIQSDNIQAAGMSHEINQFEEQTGEYSAWTNSMFGGMPSYQIKGPETFNIHLMLQRFLHLFLPYSTMAIFFVYLLGFYLLLTSLKFKRGIAVIGALAFALSSYNVIIIAAGHITKCYAIAYMAPVLAGIIHCYNKEYIKGFLLTTFALGIEIACNHPQILYYLAILCGLYFIYKAIMTNIEQKKKAQESSDANANGWKGFGKATAIVAIACVFAVLPNITNLWTTWEYGKYSTRSQSELSSKQQSSGLDKDYAMAWSYGISESFNIMIPDFKGGASGAISDDRGALDAVKDKQMIEPVANSNHYWGDQPFTSGPVYMGAAIVFLFILGMFVVQSTAKWWLVAGAFISLVMSWGNNFSLVTDVLFDYFPLYNKFRSVSMALVIAQVCVPFLAMMTLKEYSDHPEYVETKKKALYVSLGITAGLCLLFLMFPGLSGSFLSDEESAQFASIIAEHPEAAGQYQSFMNNLEYARHSIFRSDVFRTLLFILAAAAMLFIYRKLELKPKTLFIFMGLIIVLDLWNVDYRYLGPKDYRPATEVSNVLRPTPADEFIMKDTDPNFRVLNLGANVFNDGKTPYFHKSIGGYHGAKMRRYQEFIDTLLSPAVNYARALAQQDAAKFNSFVSNNNTINMLNTKYLILNPQQMPLINMNSYGNAWFVNKFDAVETADQEIGSLKRQDSRQTAVINKNIFKDYMSQLPKDQIVAEDSSTIVLTKYQPNYISYDADAKRDRLAVFSEIYYPKGWQAYIDGKEVDHICADYILRALVVPAGQHKIEFRFDPTSIRVGKIIAAIASSLLILALLAYLYKVYVMDKKKN